MPFVLPRGHGCTHPPCSSTATGVCAPCTLLGLWAPSVFLYSHGCSHPVQSPTAVLRGACTTRALPALRVNPRCILLHSYACTRHAPAWLWAFPTSTALRDWEGIHRPQAPPQLWVLPPCTLLHSCGCYVCSYAAGVLPPQAVLLDCVCLHHLRSPVPVPA